MPRRADARGRQAGRRNHRAWRGEYEASGMAAAAHQRRLEAALLSGAGGTLKDAQKKAQDAISDYE